MKNDKASVPPMTPNERAKHGVYITPENYAALQNVASRLTSKYPPDWFERHGKELYLHVLGTLCAAAVVLSFCGVGLWAWLLPVLGFSLIMSNVPHWLWERQPGVPRWAHKNAQLDTADIELVSRVIESLKPVQRASVSAFVPANTGLRFWQIMWRAEAFNSGHSP